MKISAIRNAFKKPTTGKEKKPAASGATSDVVMAIPEKHKNRISSMETALSKITSGDRIFVGTACATPRTLIMGLENLEIPPDDIQIFHFLTDGAICEKNGILDTRYRHKVFFVGTDTRASIKKGQAQYIPISMGQLPDLIEKGRLPFDVALIQVSMPDDHGFVSLGVSVDITRAAALQAKTVIAEINPNMPYTLGDTFIPMDRVDHMVIVDTPVTEYLHQAADDVVEQIARYTARIIEDNATLQIGLGQIPNEMLKYLDNRKNLRCHHRTGGGPD